jgi:hypothetical protein
VPYPVFRVYETRCAQTEYDWYMLEMFRASHEMGCGPVMEGNSLVDVRVRRGVAFGDLFNNGKIVNKESCTMCGAGTQ